MNRVFLTNNIACNFTFNQTPRTFKVTENSNIKLQKRGEFKLLKVTKVSISTIELIEYLCSVLKIKEKEIGYAGLKDKHATTTQYLTIPKWVNVKKFKNSDRVNIEELGFCANRLKIGDLKSNSFEIILEDVDNQEYIKIVKAFNTISKLGFANFFGYQRFGILDDASIKGKKISDFGKGVKNQKSRIILAAYQAKLFNNWLNERLILSKNIIDGKKTGSLKKLHPTLLDILKNSKVPFKILPGDLAFYYKKGRKEFLTINKVEKFLNNFEDKKLYPTGVLFGSSVRLSSQIAGEIERNFVDYSFDMLKGARRAAWIWSHNNKINYNENRREVTISFTLLPGCYATVLLEELANSKLS